MNAALSSLNAGGPEEAEVRFRTLLNLVGEPIQKLPGKTALFVHCQCMALAAPNLIYMGQNQLTEAEDMVRQVLKVRRDAYRAEPENHVFREALGEASVKYYRIYKSLEKPREAEAGLLEALERAEAAQKAEPAIFDRSRALIYLLEQTADLYQTTDRLAEALIDNERLLECARAWLAIEGYIYEVRANFADAILREAGIYSSLGNHAEVIRLFEQGLRYSAPESQPWIQAQLILERLAAGS